MNILYYLKSFPKLTESFILNELHHLEKRGHNVAVFSIRKPSEKITHSELEDLDIQTRYYENTRTCTRMEQFRDTYTYGKMPGILQEKIRSSEKILQARECRNFINELEWQPEHLHTHFAVEPNLGAERVAEREKLSFTATAHAFDIFNGAEISRPELLKKTDRIITISRYNREFIEQNIAPGKPIDVIRAGIDPEKFQPGDEEKDNRVLTVSRLVEKKGIDQALKAVEKTGEELEYRIIGRGVKEEELLEKTRRLGIEEHVEFLGNISDEQLLKEINEAKCFLLPCRIAENGDRDGIPVAMMEAMAMKTPPVTTSISGIPELVDNEENGIIVDPENTEGLAEALEKLLQDEEKRREIGEKARKKIENEFNIKKEIKKLEQSFQKARR